MIGAAGELAADRGAWSGTLIVVFQPAEELGRDVPRTRRPAPTHQRRNHAYGVPVSHPARTQPAADKHRPITRIRRAAAGLLATGLLLTGCGNTSNPTGTAATQADVLPTAPSSAPTATLTPDPSPSTSATTTPTEPVRLPWPAADATAAAELQRSVDAGSQPWLLDPAEVAISYATAAYGWTQAEAQPRPGGHTVDVAEGGRKLTLSLTQPGRAGAGGIWVVTGESG